jgi:hypothetical protein
MLSFLVTISYKFGDEPCSTSRVLATVRECHVDTSKHREFGQYRGGCIVLSAPVVRARLSTVTPTKYYGYRLFHTDSK